jgi:hypothetical protein
MILSDPLSGLRMGLINQYLLLALICSWGFAWMIQEE